MSTCKSNLGSLMLVEDPNQNAKKYPLALSGVILFVPLTLILIFIILSTIGGKSDNFSIFDNPLGSFVWACTSSAITCLIIAANNKCE